MYTTLCSIEDEDREDSFWIDEEQRQEEKRTVLNEAISHITDGRVSPIAPSLSSNWQSTSSSQKSYYLRKVRQVFSAVLSTVAPDQEDQVFEAVLRSSGHEIQEKPTMLRKMFSATKLQFCLNLTTNLKVVILNYKFCLCLTDIFQSRNAGR